MLFIDGEGCELPNLELFTWELRQVAGYWLSGKWITS